MSTVAMKGLAGTHHRIIKHPIKFLGMTIGYRKELKIETFAAGLKRIYREAYRNLNI